MSHVYFVVHVYAENKSKLLSSGRYPPTMVRNSELLLFQRTSWTYESKPALWFWQAPWELCSRGLVVGPLPKILNYEAVACSRYLV